MFKNKTKYSFVNNYEKGSFFDENISAVRNALALGIPARVLPSYLGISPEQTFLLMAAAKILDS